MLLDAGGALLLAALGVLLICAEFCLPGWVIPGVAGGVCLLCGIFRLSTLGANAGVAAGLLLILILVAAAGYGLAPVGFAVLLLAVPLLCRWLLPGAIGWPVAALASLPAMAIFLLLRVASKAVENKTLLQ